MTNAENISGVNVATFVLIHGAWHGGWCWDQVAPLLRTAGHEVIAPDLPGMGEDRTDLHTITLPVWAQFVANLAKQASAPVILVGHSRGGIVISAAAELVPERIRTLVYLTAFLVPNGKTLADMLALSEPRPVARDAIVMSADNTTSTIVPAKVVPVFYNTTPPALCAQAAKLLTPEPMMSFATPIMTSAARYGRVKRAYIECEQDNAIPLERQRLMQRALPCDPVITLDTDHSPFYSAPGAVRDALLDLAL